MLRSRFFSSGLKLFSAVCAFGLFAALLSALGSNGTNDQGFMDRIIGPLSVGWKGGVGDHVAYTYLVTLFVAALVLLVLFVSFQDSDPDVQASDVSLDTAPITPESPGMSYLPISAAGALVLLALGWVGNTILFEAGIGLLFVIGCAWTLRAWSEQVSSNAETNDALYHRFIDPFQIPFFAVVTVGFVAIGVSRVLLAVSEKSSVMIFGGFATVLFVVAAMIAMQPVVSKTLAKSLVALIVAIVLIFAVSGIIAGEREFHHSETPHATTEHALQYANNNSLAYTTNVLDA